MDSFSQWWTRFTQWVRYEPVRAAESVRALLFALTAVLAMFGAEVEATAIAGGVTALFSIYASRTVRNKVSPVAKLEDQREYLSEDKAADYESAVNGKDIPV